MTYKMSAFAADSSSEDSEEDQDFMRPSADPRADEFADYNPRKRRRTGRDPKESAALGIFGSESESEGQNKKWKSKVVRRKGMAFVKSDEQDKGNEDDDDDDREDNQETEDRIQTVSKNDQADMDTNMEDEVDEDMDEKTQPRMGLGASLSGGHGREWQSPAFSRVRSEASFSSPLGRGFTPSSANIPVLQVTDYEPTTNRVPLPSAFGNQTRSKSGMAGNSQAASGPAGSFAKRMMEKMGYKEGQGLGKEGQGRNGVIEVQLRPMGAGLGAVREKSKQERDEERRQAAIRGEKLEDSDEEERKKRGRKGKISGTDSGTSTPKRRPPKPKYQSFQELKRAAPGLHIPEAFTPILDLTGPNQKLLTTSSGLLTPTTGTEPNELIEGKKLARRAQNDLTSFVEEWNNLEERKAWIQMEILQQQQSIDEQRTSFEELNSVGDIVQDLAQAVQDGQWDPVLSALKSVGPEGTGSEELSSIAVAAIHPFFRQAIEGWQPLEDPKLNTIASGGFAPALYGIRELLTKNPKVKGDGIVDNESNHRSHKTTPYESMMYAVWFPKVRSAIINSWDAHDPTPLQALLDAWEGLIPTFIQTQILEKLIVQKLDGAVTAWNPKKKRGGTPPHLWLFPWLQFLASHHADPRSSTGLLSDVKRKFRQLIDAWDFRRGMIPGLQQWQSVLNPDRHSDQWTPLMRNYVLPNLARFLRNNFQVAPQDQEPFMRYLNDTLLWTDILGRRVMGQLLVDVMFPMWHNVLHQWLTLDEVNYQEVGEWLNFWRNLIPEDLNAVKAIKAEWQKGNNMINLALDLGPNNKSRLPPPVETIDSRSPRATSPTKGSPPIKGPSEIKEIPFRDQVEDWCAANDVQFLPEKNTLDANGPVYRVTAAPVGKGGVLIYLRGQNIFAQIKRGEWTTLGREMDALLALAYR